MKGFGDHLGTFVTLDKKLEKTKTKKIKIRNFKKYDPENFNKELKEKLDTSNISDLLTENLVNEATEKFTCILIAMGYSIADFEFFMPHAGGQFF